MFNPYEHMRSKWRKDYADTIHWQNLFLSLCSMFEWKNLPDTLRPELIESLLITQGTCGVTEMSGGIYTGIGSYTGEPVNFLPTEYIVTNVGVGEKTFNAESGGVVCWNNSLRLPDWMLMQYSSILTEIDISESVNVLFTRFLRIPRVKNAKEKAAIETVVSEILTGKFNAIIDTGVQDEIFQTDPENRFFDLCDVDKVDKLQYLNQYRDNIVKRWFQVYGQGMQSTAKLAQQTTDELHGNDSVSMIIPLDRLKCRQDFCEKLNAMYGTNVSVDFSESYKESREEMEETYSNGTKEETPATEGGESNDSED